jgi:16S rRNA processing protein RimM
LHRAADVAPAMPEDAVEVGRILGAWGIQGGLKVKPFASDPQALFSSKRWFIQPPEGPRPVGLKPGGPLPTLLRVISAREHGDGVVATVHDLSDRNGAEALRGARIFVPRSSFPTPEAGEFYWIDLIGMSVVTRAGVALGTVIGLLETGPHCVLQVQAQVQEANAEIPERLIPFVDAYVDKVDVPTRCITVDWDLDY